MKILLLDIENTPSIGYIWSLWSEVKNYSFIDKEWYILCFSAKWLDSKEIISSALPDFKGYKKNPESDKEVLLKLRDLLDEADVVIAHNGVNFDRRKINARFIANGINPPSPYKLVDTLLISRREFAFTSNRLNDIAQFLKLGRKNDTGGFDLWKKCLAGDREAWKQMVEYNRMDIILLEKVYLKLLPFITQHPNAGTYSDCEDSQCPKCGSSQINYRGYSYTNLSKFRQFVCKVCSSWGRERVNILSKDKRSNLATNAT